MEAKILQRNSFPLPQMLVLATFLFLSPVISANFIRRSCESTQHPKLCYNSLSPFENRIHNSFAQLAHISITVSLVKARQTATYITNLSRQIDNSRAKDRQVVEALNNCVISFGSSLTQLENSNNRMRRPGKGEELQDTLDDVDMAIDLAIGFEQLCLDGWSDVANGHVKAGVCRHSLRLQKLMTNARDLVIAFDRSVS